MSLNRIIPTLLLQEKKLVKTKNFQNPQYVGDPKNTIKLFNEMNCPEIILLDINLTSKNNQIDYNYLKNIISEAFMPVSYGGGVKNLDDINKLLNIGCEKVSLNSKSYDDDFIEKAVKMYGSSSIVVSIDILKLKDKYFCYDYIKKRVIDITIQERIELLNKYNIGEYLINFVDKDGLMNGYDQDGIKQILKFTNSQITFCGGASSYENIKNTILCGAKSLGAGSLFIYQSLDSGVLINFPDGEEYTEMLEL
tara:strand:+ start:104 stop:859 length:756 start_codon:yes stop_codon:yes gene_type:complete